MKTEDVADVRACTWDGNDTIIKVDFFTSPFISGRALFYTRLTLWISSLAIAILILGENTDETHDSFPIYLSLSFISFCAVSIYFFILLYHAYSNQFVYKQCVSYAYNLLDREDINCWERFIWIFYEVLLTTSLLVSLVYWILVFPGSDAKPWVDFCLHIPLPMILELILSRFPIIFPLHFLFPFLFGVGYFIFEFLFTKFLSYKRVYKFLSYDDPLPYYALIIGLDVAIFTLCFWFIQLRHRISVRFFSTVPLSSEEINFRSSDSEFIFSTSIDSSDRNTSSYYASHSYTNPRIQEEIEGIEMDSRKTGIFSSCFGRRTNE